MAENSEAEYTATGQYSEDEPTPDETKQVDLKNINKEEYCKAVRSLYPQIFGWPIY